MQTKLCSNCKTHKEAETNFRWRKNRNTWNSSCRQCENEAEKLRYKTKPKKQTYTPEQRLLKSRKAARRRKEIPQLHIGHLTSVRIRNILKGQGLSKGCSSTWKHLPYTKLQLKQHIEAQFEPWMNWNNLGPYKKDTWNDNDPTTWTWNLDHIIPASLFNYQTMNDPSFQECWALSNLRPLSSKQNINEGNRRAH